MEKVSVVIPTYKRSDKLKRAILSVLNQTYANLEVIIADDCSPDDTSAVVGSIKDPRIKYIRHESNKGGSATRNTGIKNASGTYIAFLDDDDEWLPNKIEKQVSKFNEVGDKIGIIYTGYISFNEEDGSERMKRIPSKKGEIFKDQLIANIPLTSSVLIKKEILEKHGMFDERLPSCQEWELFIRLSKDVQFDFVPEVLVRMAHHSNRISTNLKSKINGLNIVLETHLKEFSKFPKVLSGHYYLLGFCHAVDKDYKKARHFFIKALSHNPFYGKVYAHLLLSLLAPNWHSEFLNKRRHVV